MSSEPSSPPLHRRGFLGAGAALALAGSVEASGAPEPSTIYERIFSEQMTLDPERATQLGVDIGPLAPLRARLTDRSGAGRGRVIDGAARQLAELNRLPARQAATLDARVVREILDDTARRARFPYASLAGMSTPYPVSTLTGVYQSSPDLFGREQPLATIADAHAYVTRLEALGAALDQDTETITTNARSGASPPDFLVDMTLIQLRTLRAARSEDSVFAQSFRQRATPLGLPESLIARAATIVADTVYPALDRQIAALDLIRRTASPDAGVWRLPDGDQYYAVALRTETTTKLSPDEVHAIGLEEVARIDAELDQQLRRVGLTEGSAVDRLNHLADDPANYYTNGEAGRTALIADIRRQIAETYTRLPAYFHQFPPNTVDVRRVPPFQEAGYPGGSYVPAAPDHSRQALFSMNLSNMHDRPNFGFPTLTFHETVPGHHLQLGLMEQLVSLPAIRRHSEFSAYTEGWGVYAETLGAEMALPNLGRFAQIGYLQSMLFRAARLVVDTGLHAKRWTRNQATDELVRISGLSRPRAGREIDRYCVFPGQACSYMIGARTWRALREQARTRLGARFDIRDFHQLLVAGPMPLDLLGEVQAASLPA